MKMDRKLWCVDIFVLCVVCVQWVNTAPTQRFPFGTIEGVDIQSYTSRRPVYAYYGVPFAEPPVGDLRFRAPVAYQGRLPNTVISSTNFRAACMQGEEPGAERTGPMSEDCLHLNIFVPGSQSVGLRKVMVWIHGGGFVYGDARGYVPTDLVADYDVIVVSVQYRL